MMPGSPIEPQQIKKNKALAALFSRSGQQILPGMAIFTILNFI